jgi:ATP-dependent DNA helicase HFM1/MER3
MKEYFIFKRNYKGAINSTLLAKSLYQKLWDDSPYLLKQLPGIGMVTAKVNLLYCNLEARFIIFW